MWGALSERCWSQIVTNKIKFSIYQLEPVDKSSGGINGTNSTLMLGSEEDCLVFLCGSYLEFHGFCQGWWLKCQALGEGLFKSIELLTLRTQHVCASCGQFGVSKIVELLMKWNNQPIISNNLYEGIYND